MKPASSSRKFRAPLLSFLNAALWTLLLFGVARLVFPLAEQAQASLNGWNSQRQFREQWREATQHAKPKKHAHSARKASKKPAAVHQAAFHPKPKWPLTRLICERMNLDAAVVEGTSAKALLDGPGHDPRSSTLGEGNCVIAAHRNMAGWWFYRLDELKPGDRVTLETPDQIFTYRIKTVKEVRGDDLSVLRATPKTKPRLTLYSCTLPKTTKRLVAVADLQDDFNDY